MGEPGGAVGIDGNEIHVGDRVRSSALVRRVAMLLAVVLATAGTLVLNVAPSGAASTAPTAPSGSDISITQTPSGGGLPICLPPFLSLRQSVSQTATTFSLRVDVTTRLCAPLEAAAVVYAMPGNGVAWPQTLVERVDFTLQEAGTTVITFTKRCDPVQFDVITGASPPVIFPFFGDFHGPLLFPFDVSTSLQWFGCVDPECEEYTPTDIAASPSDATPGTTLDVSGSGFPGTTIEVVLRSPDGTVTPAASSPIVADDGTWSTTATIPGDAVDGTWVVAANAENCQTAATTEVQVTGGGDAGNGGDGGTDPTTTTTTVAEQPDPDPVGGDETTTTVDPTVVGDGEGPPAQPELAGEVAGEVVVADLPAAAVAAAPEVAGATAVSGDRSDANGTAAASGLAFRSVRS